VLLVADQFMIDRNTCDLKLSGEIVPDSMLFGELWKFFKTFPSYKWEKPLLRLTS
jgi:hypothetical protein